MTDGLTKKTSLSYSSVKIAQTHYELARSYEANANWNRAYAEYEEAAQICQQLGVPAMLALVRTYQARVLRNIGEIKQGFGHIEQANALLIELSYNRTSLYVRAEIETVWGTLYLKLPLSQDKQEAIEHFEKAIEALEQLRAEFQRNKLFIGSLGFLINITDQVLLQQEINHNIGVNKINLANMYLSQEEYGTRQATQIADEIMVIAEGWNDWKLKGAAARIKGEIADQGGEFHQAMVWYARAIDAYKKYPGYVNPEAIKGTESLLQRTQTILALERYESEGSPKRFKWFKKVPRPIVYFYKPFLFTLDSRAKTIPATHAWKLYRDAFIHWDGADWHDRAYQCLVKAVEYLDQIRSNVPLGGEFYTHRRTEFFSQGAERILNWMLMSLMSPKHSRDTGIAHPIPEAFYYREKLGSIGLLDELEATKTINDLFLAQVKNQGKQEKLEQLREVDSQLISIETKPHSRSIASSLEERRIGLINELCLENKELFDFATGYVARLEDVQVLLPERTMLIEYVLTDLILAAFVVTRESASIAIFECSDLRYVEPLVYPKECIQKVQEFLKAIGHEITPDGKSTGSGLPQQHDVHEVKLQGKWLYDILVRPTEVMWWREGKVIVDRLIIVPQGILHQLPFSALFDGVQFVAEKVPTVQSPSASVLRYCYNKRPNKPPPFTFFGFANPKPPGNIPGCEGATLSAVRALGFKDQWTGDVLEDVQKSFLIVRGKAATRTIWLENASHYTCVDLATHGDFTAGNSLSHRFLVIGEDGKESWLTARDIFLNLQMRPELLIASMCYSGQMEILRGDEPVGLIRAFMFAGCRSILLYPWALEDRTAEAFMREFYQHFIKSGDSNKHQITITKDVALQKAQIHLIKRGRQGESCKNFDENVEPVSISWEHPHYWAWMLIGDHA